MYTAEHTKQKLNDLTDTAQSSVDGSKPANNATYLRSQTDDLPPALHPQVGADHAAYARSQHLPLVVQQHRRVVVEADEPAVRSADRLAGTDDDGASDVAPADLEGGGGQARAGGHRTCAFDDADDLVSDAPPAVVDFVFEHVDALDDERARVVYDLSVQTRLAGQMVEREATHINAAFKTYHNPQKTRERWSGMNK